MAWRQEVVACCVVVCEVPCARVPLFLAAWVPGLAPGSLCRLELGSVLGSGPVLVLASSRAMALVMESALFLVLVPRLVSLLVSLLGPVRL